MIKDKKLAHKAQKIRKSIEKKETAAQEDLLKVLELMDSTEISYWLDGGWGVDVLVGK